ncbi:hypothetical protein [Pseudomonas viridiflava]|uniref:hypothetical protein n=1 Tax=Pseudomonas viridiflava TaxID=33069 RepID=UPI000F02677A|nr:hypothetical protein [Pseudomonas viridiflava]
MMLPYAQRNVIDEIIKSWRHDRSNYILVCAPMNGERQLLNSLTSEQTIAGVIGEAYHALAIASLDTSDFKSEIIFAKSVAKRWSVTAQVAGEDDPRTILEVACASVVQQGRVPILIINRFHEALDKLGEDIGSTLRDMEHVQNLKTVVSMPVSLNVLRERWELMDPNKAPFLASDWGQGHRCKILKGYSCAEIIELGKDRALSADVCNQLFKASGGAVDIVNILVDEVESRKGKGLSLYLQQRSGELCARALSWLDPINSAHIYKRALVSLLDNNFYPSALGYIMDHDWKPILLSKEGKLNFEMLAWASAAALAKSSEVGLHSAFLELYGNENYPSIRNMIKTLIGTDSKNVRYWTALHAVTLFCEYSSDVFTHSDNWKAARLSLTQLLEDQGLPDPVYKALRPLAAWKPLSKLLSEFLTSKAVQPDLRIENHICLNGDRNAVIPFLQLLLLRLNRAEIDDTFQSLQSVIHSPESILQIYAHFELGISFWNFKGMDNAAADELEKFARKPYRISGSILGYSDLAHLVALRSSLDASADSLISSYEELQDVLAKYEIRKENSHSTAFTEASTCQQYRRFFKNLLERYLAVFSLTISESTLPPPKLCALKLLEFAPRSSSFAQ